MSFKEAQEDGIKSILIDGIKKYITKCHVCNVDIHTHYYQRGIKYICKTCKEYKEYRANLPKIEAGKKKLKTAIKRLREQCVDIAEYKSAIMEIEKILEKPRSFQSTEEIMMALQLCKEGIFFGHQVKIENYTADFVLPKEHIILEVDGLLYHTEKTRAKENIRDEYINRLLGKKWITVRVSDEVINFGIEMLTPTIISKSRNDKQ